MENNQKAKVKNGFNKREFSFSNALPSFRNFPQFLKHNVIVGIAIPLKWVTSQSRVTPKSFNDGSRTVFHHLFIDLVDQISVPPKNTPRWLWLGFELSVFDLESNAPASRPLHLCQTTIRIPNFLP